MNRTTDVTCPSCGTVSHFDQMRRDAQEFCRRCDYPLFWVRSSEAPVGEGSEGDVGLRRLPGAGGRQVVASLGCPACNEPNLYAATVCIRCGADMHPAPAMPVVAAPPPPPPAPPPPPEPEVGPVWPYYVGLVGVPTAIALALIAVIH